MVPLDLWYVICSESYLQSKLVQFLADHVFIELNIKCAAAVA